MILKKTMGQVFLHVKAVVRSAKTLERRSRRKEGRSNLNVCVRILRCGKSERRRKRMGTGRRERVFFFLNP